MTAIDTTIDIRNKYIDFSISPEDFVENVLSTEEIQAIRVTDFVTPIITELKKVIRRLDKEFEELLCKKQ